MAFRVLAQRCDVYLLRAGLPQGAARAIAAIFRLSLGGSMSAQDKELEQVILTRIVRLNAKIQGTVTGLIAGFVLFLATNWLVLKGGYRVGPHLSLLGQFFIGYRVSFVGSLIGFTYAFLRGFVAGYAVAWIYNRIADRRQRAR